MRSTTMPVANKLMQKEQETVIDVRHYNIPQLIRAVTSDKNDCLSSLNGKGNFRKYRKETRFAIGLHLYQGFQFCSDTELKQLSPPTCIPGKIMQGSGPFIEEGEKLTF